MRIGFASLVTVIVLVLSALTAAACGGQERGQEKQPEQEEAPAVQSETTTVTREASEVPKTPKQATKQPPKATRGASEVPKTPKQVTKQPPKDEIAVTGVLKDTPDKWDGTPAYGITDESTVTGKAPPIGYILEGDYSAYLGRRVTVYGTPRKELHVPSMRILDVSRIELAE